MSDAVNHPAHYGGDSVYEVIKVLEAWELDGDAYLFQAVKYIARAGKKDPAKTIEDLEKAEFYVRRRIDLLKSEDPSEGEAPADFEEYDSDLIPTSD